MSTLVVPPAESQPVSVPLRWFAIWFKAITRPTVGNYENLLAQPHGGLGRALLWIFLAGLAGGLLATAIYPGFLHIDPTSGDIEWYFVLQFDIVLLGWVIFLVYLTLQGSAARLMGGQGELANLAFLSAAYTGPLILLSAVLSGVSTVSINGSAAMQPMEAGIHPVVQVFPDTPGWFLGRNAVLTLLLIGFSWVAVRAVYRLQALKAFLVVLAPTVLTACAVFGFTSYMWVQNIYIPEIQAKYFPPVHGSEEPAAIYKMNIDGSQLVRITDESASDELPIWSPDGRRIAFTSVQGGSADIYLINPDGSARTRLTYGPGQNSAAAWSPDGKQIAFISDRSGYSNIYVMNADGSNVKRLTDDPANDAEPAWSPDGNHIAFSSDRDVITRVYVMDASGNDVKLLADWTLAGSAPSWSPDGTQIAINSGQGNQMRICIVTLADGNVNWITDGKSEDLWPIWSPDGKRIAFVSTRDSEGGYRNDEIYVMDVTGKNQERLTYYDGEDGAPSWSPDGTQIVFASRRP